MNAIIEGLRARTLLDADGQVTHARQATRERVEALTDRLAEPPYDALTPVELDQLLADLTPISAPINALLPW